MGYTKIDKYLDWIQDNVEVKDDHNHAPVELYLSEICHGDERIIWCDHGSVLQIETAFLVETSACRPGVQTITSCCISANTPRRGRIQSSTAMVRDLVQCHLMCSATTRVPTSDYIQY